MVSRLPIQGRTDMKQLFVTVCCAWYCLLLGGCSSETATSDSDLPPAGSLHRPGAVVAYVPGPKALLIGCADYGWR